MGAYMKLIINKTHNGNQIGTVEATFTSPEPYIAYLSLFNVEIEYKDALKDVVEDDVVELTLSIDQDYAISH